MVFLPPPSPLLHGRVPPGEEGRGEPAEEVGERTYPHRQHCHGYRQDQGVLVPLLECSTTFTCCVGGKMCLVSCLFQSHFCTFGMFCASVSNAIP